MEAATHTHHEHHHEMPTSGRALSGVALSATLHCLTGCALGEIAGMVIGTALGFSDLGTILLAVALAFLFGYTLTSLPLLRAGLALGAVVPIAFASDTLSIATMEVVDNAIMLTVPGAMDAGLADVLFWGALSVALVIAGGVAFPVNRWLIARGKGHVAVHETGIHGGPDPRLIGVIAVVAAVFGTTVLVVDAITNEDGGHRAMSAEHGGGAAAADPVRGLAVSANGLTLQLDRTEAPLGRPTELRFTVRGEDGRPVRDFEVEHERRMHLIVARRDLTGFQHLHPKLSATGEWSARTRFDEAGSYRVFADFKHDGENQTLASDLAVDGPADWQPLPPAATTADAGDGYKVSLAAEPSRAEREAELGFRVTRDGRPVAVEDYLGAKGHLVALRQGDLAYLHVHPEHGGIRFATEFPTAGRYRLFLQFKRDGKVRTAAFTRNVGR